MSINWTEIYKKYKGKWVALLKDETTVVGFGSTAKQAMEKALKDGYQNPILMKVPQNLQTYVGYEVSL